MHIVVSDPVVQSGFHLSTNLFPLFSQKNRSTSNQVYFNITAYDWFHGKREDTDDVEQIERTVRLRNVSMDDDAYQYDQQNDNDDVEIDAPTPVIVKVIRSKPKAVKIPAKSRRKIAEIIDDNQDRVNSFFENLFPMKRGESSSDQFFCIDDRSQTGSGSVKCKICLEEFVSALKLKSHLIVHKNLMYKCQYCPLEVCEMIFSGSGWKKFEKKNFSWPTTNTA